MVALAVSLLTVVALGCGFLIGRGLGMVQESQAEEKQAEVLNDVLGFAQGIDTKENE